MGFGGDAEGDTLTGVENLIGSDHADLLSGDEGNNTIYGRDGDDGLFGGAGDDLLVGGAGDNRFQGGAGADILDGRGGENNSASYAFSDAGVTVDLITGTGLGGEAEGDVLLNINNLTGSNHGDVLIGNSEANSLAGRDGNDTLIGGAGNDVLAGGAGADILIGGEGRDTFSLISQSSGADIVTDFENDIDFLRLFDTGFADVDSLLDIAEQIDDDVVIDFDGGNVLTVMNTTIAELADDIILN